MTRVRPVLLIVLVVVFAFAVTSIGTERMIAGVVFGAGAVILAIAEVIAVRAKAKARE